MPKRAALGDLTNATIGKSFFNKRNFTKITKVENKGKILKHHVDVTCKSVKTSTQIKTENIKKSPEKKPVAVEEPPKLPEGVTDIDEENKHNPLLAPEYAKDIFNYYREREGKFLVKPYLHRQPGLTGRIRAILVDWLVEVQEMMEVTHETLYQAVKMVDQYLEKRTVPKERLQLLGMAAMWIACKYEERCCPVISDFLYMSDNCYTHEDMVNMECEILKTTNFDIGAPLSYIFLRRFAKADNMEMDMLTLARYILEMSLHDYDMVFELESIKAAASLFLALRMKNLDWNPQLQYYSGYKKEELLSMARRLNLILHTPPREISSVKKKYSHRVFFHSAKVPLLPLSSPCLQDVKQEAMES